MKNDDMTLDDMAEMFENEQEQETIKFLKKRNAIKVKVDKGENVILTYDEWRAAGYQVNKGEKAKAKNVLDKALFEVSQCKNLLSPYVKFDTVVSENERLTNELNKIKNSFLYKLLFWK